MISIRVFGEVPKRLKVLPWKGSRSLIAVRGFKSRLLRLKSVVKFDYRFNFQESVLILTWHILIRKDTQILYLEVHEKSEKIIKINAKNSIDK